MKGRRRSRKIGKSEGFDAILMGLRRLDEGWGWQKLVELKIWKELKLCTSFEAALKLQAMETNNAS
jgi:hypothetical protein